MSDRRDEPVCGRCGALPIMGLLWWQARFEQPSLGLAVCTGCVLELENEESQRRQEAGRAPRKDE